MLKIKYHKNIEKEIAKAENLLADKNFIIFNDGFPIDNCEIELYKNNDKNNFNFNLNLKTKLNPEQITFKKLGLNENFKIVSSKETYIVPAKGTTKISAKSFVQSENIKGELSTLHSELFPLESDSFFRLILKIEESYLTTIFLGSEYSCNEIHYSLGLINIEIENSFFHIYRYTKNEINYLAIECLNKINFQLFRDTCETTLKSIGFLTGNWYQKEHYFFSYKSLCFEEPLAFYYCFFGNSVISNQEIINPQQYRSFINIDTNNIPKLTPLLFPEETLSRLITQIKSKPELERTIELIIEGNEIESPLIKCSIFSVALETVTSLIQSENKTYFEPIKNTKKLNPVLKELQSIIDKEKANFTELEYNILSKKITYLNTPFNKDKFLLSYKLYNIDLPQKLELLLNTRNKYLHGKTPYEEGLLKAKIKELHLEADRLHMLVSILILKYIGYRGHIKNQAGYRLENKKYYDEDNIEINESAFYVI